MLQIKIIQQYITIFKEHNTNQLLSKNIISQINLQRTIIHHKMLLLSFKIKKYTQTYNSYIFSSIS